MIIYFDITKFQTAHPKILNFLPRTSEPNQKGTVLGGPNWKIEGKWAENDKKQSIFEGQGGPDPPTSGGR